MASPHVKKDDTVVVIAGADKGRRGRVLELDRQKNRVIVEGVNTRKKHLRRNQANPQGGIEERDSPIHISNVMKADVFDERTAKRGGETTDSQPQSKGE